MRSTRSNTGNRRSHHALDTARLSKCGNCGGYYLRHRACGTCGQYRGRSVVNVTAKIEKKSKKKESRTKEAAK